MRDDSRRWDAPTPLAISTPDVEVREVLGLRQMLISGPNVQTAFKDLVGWPTPAPSEPYTVSLRRDRGLQVQHDPRPEGFDADANIAVTDMSDATCVFDISGSGALALLRCGAELSLDQPSRSTMRHVFGVEVMLYRHRDDSTFRLHVPRAQVMAISGLMRAAARSLS